MLIEKKILLWVSVLGSKIAESIWCKYRKRIQTLKTSLNYDVDGSWSEVYGFCFLKKLLLDEFFVVVIVW